MPKIPDVLLPEYFAWMRAQERNDANQINRMRNLHKSAEAFIAKHGLCVSPSTALYQYLMQQE